MPNNPHTPPPTPPPPAMPDPDTVDLEGTAADPATSSTSSINPLFRPGDGNNQN